MVRKLVEELVQRADRAALKEEMKSAAMDRVDMYTWICTIGYVGESRQTCSSDEKVRY